MYFQITDNVNNINKQIVELAGQNKLFQKNKKMSRILINSKNNC